MNRNASKKPTKPRRPPAPPVIDVDEDDDDLPLAGELEEDVDEELEALRHELGEDVNRGRVVVHKVVQNGDPQRCFACPLSQFFSDTIREQWGAGTYSYMVYVGNKLKTRGRITFAQPLTPSTTSSPASRDERSLSDLETRFEQRLEREQARHFEMLKLLTGRPQLDPLQMQSQILTMLTTVKELTGARGEDSGRTSIDLFLEGVRMAQKFGGGEGGTDWGAIVESVVAGARALSQEQRRVPRALPSPQPNGNPATAVTPATAGETDEDADMMGKLTKALQFLVKKAQAGASAELYADVTIDNIEELPAFLQPIVLDYLQRPDCLERLIQLEPAVAQHREWFTQLVTEIRRVLSEQAAPETLTAEGAPPDSHA